MSRLSYRPDDQTNAAVNLTKEQAGEIARKSKQPSTGRFTGTSINAPLPPVSVATKQQQQRSRAR